MWPKTSNFIKLNPQIYKPRPFIYSQASSFQEETVCPPGFIEYNQTCICSVNTNYEYLGITSCDLTTWRAMRSRGYWIGYEIHLNESQDSLVSSYCPPNYCNHSNILLPNEANKKNWIKRFALTSILVQYVANVRLTTRSTIIVSIISVNGGGFSIYSVKLYQ